MITYLRMSDSQFIHSDVETQDTIWISVENPTAEEITQLVTTYDLPLDYITGALDDNENSRFETTHKKKTVDTPSLTLLQYPAHVLSPSGYTQFNTFPFAIILTTNKKIITVANDFPDFLNHLLSTSIPEIEVPIPEGLILYLAWQISTSYNQFLKELLEQTNQLEKELKITTENNQLYQMMDIQKSLVYFEAAIHANLNVLNDLHDLFILKSGRQHLPKLHDIIIETKQAATTTTIQLKLVDKISDTFSAIVSNNLNNVMKILTSLTIVLTIPTIVGGLYGMNVKLPFANQENAFWWIVLLTTGFCLFIIYHLKKRNLL